MNVTKTGWAVLAVAGFLAVAGGVQADSKATTPDDRLKEAWWQKRHEAKLELVKQGGWELVFIGDSITQGWEGGGKAVWEKMYAGRKALNLGYSGDRTEHVLWRFEHGEIDGLNPKLAVVMIGTNNTGHRKDPPADIADGVKLIVEKLKAKWPKTKILLLAIFPRGAKAEDPLRVNNDKANEILKTFADDKTVFFFDVAPKFLAADGTLPKDIMPDVLHPNTKGYEIWAEAMEPMIAKLLGEAKK